MKTEIKKGNPQAIASEIYGLICSSLVYKARSKEEIDIIKLYLALIHINELNFKHRILTHPALIYFFFKTTLPTIGIG